jgi:hypothetical protein
MIDHNRRMTASLQPT